MARLSLYHLHLIAFTASTLLTTGMAVWTWHHRDRQAAPEFFVFLLAILGWNFSSLLQLPLGFPAIEVLHRVDNLCKVVMSVSWLYFTMTYAGYRSYLHKRGVRTIVWVITGFMLVVQLVPTNTINFIDPTRVTAPFTEIGYEVSLVGDIVQLFGVLFVGFGATVVVYRLVNAGYTRAWQTVAVVIAVITPILVEVFEHDVFVVGVPGVEYMALILPLSGAVYLLALYRHDLFGYQPVAKHDVIDAIDDPAIVLNPDMRVVDYNDAAHEVVFDSEVALGADAQHALPGELLATDSVHEFASGSEEVELSVNGDTRYYDMNVTTLEAVGHKQGLAIFLRDITALRERTQDFEQQTEQLNEFTRIVNHYLRNPLAIASAYAGDLQTDIEDDRLDTVIDSLDEVDELIEDALTLAREGRVIENGGFAPVAATVDSAWSAVDTNGQTLVNEVPADVRVKTEQDRLETLFTNLFVSMVTHGPGEMTVRVGVLTDSDPCGFYVEDTGPGIPENKRDSVFEQGYTPNDSDGIKLAIVKRLADVHGWTVEVAESPEGGARFEFRGVKTGCDTS